MDDGQYEGLVAELREQPGLLARIADRLAPAVVSDDRGEGYRPLVRIWDGEAQELWLGLNGETHWLPVGVRVDSDVWRRAYVRRDGR